MLQYFNQDSDKLFIWYELRKTYLFYDTIHLVKNIRNNLLNHKRFVFPSFKLDGIKDPVNVPGGEIKWKYFHDVHDKNALLGTTLRKLQSKVPTALAIFHETTDVAIQSYFSDEKSTVDFLKLFSK